MYLDRHVIARLVTVSVVRSLANAGLFSQLCYSPNIGQDISHVLSDNMNCGGPHFDCQAVFDRSEENPDAC